MILLNAPSATPSSAANASTRVGLITRLKELTIDSRKAPGLPIVAAAYSEPRLTFGSVTSGVTAHVTTATTMARPTERAVFWTTESIVMGPREARTGAPGVPGVPGVPTPQVLGSE